MCLYATQTKQILVLKPLYNPSASHIPAHRNDKHIVSGNIQSSSALDFPLYDDICDFLREILKGSLF